MQRNRRDRGGDGGGGGNNGGGDNGNDNDNADDGDDEDDAVIDQFNGDAYQALTARVKRDALWAAC